MSSEAETAASAAAQRSPCASRGGAEWPCPPGCDDRIRSAFSSSAPRAAVVVWHDPEHPARAGLPGCRSRDTGTAPGRRGWLTAPLESPVAARWIARGPGPIRPRTRRSRATLPIPCSEGRASCRAHACSSRRAVERPPPVEHALPAGAREPVVKKHPELPERGHRALELG